MKRIQIRVYICTKARAPFLERLSTWSTSHFLKTKSKFTSYLLVKYLVANKNIHHQSPRRQSRILASFDMGGPFPTLQEIVKWIVFWGTGPRTFIILFALLVLGGILKSLKKLNTWVWKILEFRLQIGTLQKSLNYEEEINRD